jgi:hypothetical protein
MAREGVPGEVLPVEGRGRAGAWRVRGLAKADVRCAAVLACDRAGMLVCTFTGANDYDH